MNSDPATRIILDFLHFHLESHTSCNDDSVKIYDGNSTKSTQIGRKHGYCGKRAPPTLTIASTGNSLLIVFVSDDSVQTPGFNATYRGRIVYIYLISIISCAIDEGHLQPMGPVQVTKVVTVSWKRFKWYPM